MTSQEKQAGNGTNELDDEFVDNSVPVSLGEKKTLNEYVHMDAEDPSLTKWKESLGISNKGYSPPNDPRTVVIEQLSLLVNGRDPIHVDMQDEGSVEQIQKKGFVIKEDSEYRIAVRFRVQHELISGLRYVQVVRRVGMTVDKSSTMIGSYSPNETPYEFTTEPEEAPSGFLARGHYEAIGKFIDDDQVVHHVVQWSFDVTKNWKDLYFHIFNMRNSVIIGSLLATAAVGYGIYFDYKRRNDPTFRKTLKRHYKKVHEAKKQEEQIAVKKFDEVIEDALEIVKSTPTPSSAEEKELFFMQQVARGEQLFQQQPDNIKESAACFYAALKVYPQPVELFSIYERTVPEPIMNLLRAMQAKESTPTVE